MCLWERDVIRLIDTHAHIDAADFDDDRGEVLERAREAGVQAIIIAGAARTAEDMARTVETAALSPALFASCGVHPHEARYLDRDLMAALEAISEQADVIAIGESGLDYHYDHSPRGDQRAAFERHIELAERRGLPLICHIRDAHSEAQEILRSAPNVRGVIHCFTGGPADAEVYLELGYWISFSGIATFGQNADPIREAAKLTPVDRLLIETDAPYLAPVPLRGKRNEPAFIVHTATRLAEVRGESLEAIATATTDNAHTLFALPSANS